MPTYLSMAFLCSVCVFFLLLRNEYSMDISRGKSRKENDRLKDIQ